MGDSRNYKGIQLLSVFYQILLVSCNWLLEMMGRKQEIRKLTPEKEEMEKIGFGLFWHK